jgi:hypothetical protein
VNQVRRSARRAPAEIGAVDERDRKSSACSLGRDSGPDDAASDHEQVERLAAEPVDRGRASRYCHGEPAIADSLLGAS